MDQKEYLTIKEFAEAAGVSKQAVYQRLTGALKPYVSIRDGIKYKATCREADHKSI